ncbi:MAG: methyltransferase domain-containing protein [Candidatus Eremiobacterota bacterium]
MVWQPEIEEFLDRLSLAPGQRVLALGCGLGLDLPRLARRVSPGGEVIGVEPDPSLAFDCVRLVEACSLRNVRVVTGPAGALPAGPFDAVFSPWFFSLLPDVKGLLRRLRGLVPSGRLGVLDLYPSGLRVFPAAPCLERLLATAHQWASQLGLNFYLMGQLPGELVSSGFLLEGAWPRQKAEVPGTATYRWVERLLLDVGPRLVSEELLDEDAWNSTLSEWALLRVDPSTLLFSPQLVGIIGRTL